MPSQIMIFLAILGLVLNPAVAIAKPKEALAKLSQNLTTTTAETTNSGLLNRSQDETDDLPLDPLEGVAPNRVVKAVLTAYTSTPDQTDSTPCITADGTNLCKRGTEDVLAANWLPFGTRVKIPDLYGDRIFEIHDRMNKRYGFGRMDIWLNTTKAEARKFGVKRVDVEIYYITKASQAIARR